MIHGEVQDNFYRKLLAPEEADEQFDSVLLRYKPMLQASESARGAPGAFHQQAQS